MKHFLACLILFVLSTFGYAQKVQKYGEGLPITFTLRGNPEYVLTDNARNPTLSQPIDALITIVVDDVPYRAALVDFEKDPYSCSQIARYSKWTVFSNRQKEILGVHAFQTCYADGAIEFAIQLSNGTVWRKASTLSTTGGVFFSDLYIDFATRTPVDYDLRYGETSNFREQWNRIYLYSGGEGYFPVRGETVRRFYFGSRHTNIALPALLDSFGVLKGTYRTVASDPKLAGDIAKFQEYLKNGTPIPPFYSAPLGIFFPHGGPEPGEVGGDGIIPVFEGAPSPTLGLKAQTQADLRQDRNRLAAYHRVGGVPFGAAEWALGKNSQGFEYFLTRGNTIPVQIPLFANVPDFNQAKTAKGLALKEAILRYYADDEQHFCRYTKYNQAAVYLRNDPISRLRNRTICNDLQTSWSLYGDGPFVPQYEGQYLNFSLKGELSRADRIPNKGGWNLRSFGWSCDAVAGYIGTISNGPERSAHFVWANSMLTLVSKTVLPTGIGVDGVYPYESNGVPWDTYGMPKNYGAASMFQVPIWSSGIFALAINTPGDHTAVLLSTVVKSADELYFNLGFVPSIWGGNAVGPPYYPVVSRNGVPEQHLREGYGGSHWIHCWHHLALAYRVTKDRKYLSRMAAIGVPGAFNLEAVVDKTWTLEAIGALMR